MDICQSKTPDSLVEYIASKRIINNLYDKFACELLVHINYLVFTIHTPANRKCLLGNELFL